MRAVALLVVAAALAAPAAAATLRGTPNADRIDAVNGRPDTVACGAGRDIVTADLVDRVARDCEVVSRRLSVDPTDDPTSEHATEVEPDSFAYGSTLVAVFQVGRHPDGAASATGFATTRDGGRSWTPGLLPPSSFGRESDPSVAYDQLHGVWLVTTLGVSPGSGSALLVYRSPDGVHWSPAAPVASAQGQLAFDKDWIVCDNGAASLFRGRCYLAYSDEIGNVLALVVSPDGGQTWSQPVVVSPEEHGFAAQPVVRPDGTLVVLYLVESSLFAARSSDGGATFAYAAVAMQSFSRTNLLRAPPLPSADVDAAGRVYVAWPDCRFRPPCLGNDIVVSSSSDGASWSEPVRATHDGADDLVPGLAADPRRPGRLALVYYLDEGPRSLGVGLASSANGGAAWSRAQRLDTVAMHDAWLATTTGAGFVGDYMSTSFLGGRAVPIFVLAQPPLNGLLREAVYAGP